MQAARLTVVLAVGLGVLAGCSAMGSGDRAASVAVGEDQVTWAFTQADQHPERELIRVIDEAKDTLDIAIYSLTYPDIVQAIRDAAKRGVRVRLIADRIQSNGKTQKEALKLLGSAGIPLKINKHSGLMHLKVTVADGKVATTGSFNYSKSASTTNDEVFLVLRDESVAASFGKEFESMWDDESRFEPVRASIAMPDDPGSNASDSPAACNNPEIKGNINANGDKIYHVPGGAQYDRTKAEEMFCTESDAADAGFRKSLK
jgi:phosphatidylserine/phosphatidylglycerophosphate/cardiolipin synthase-like enzyme